MRPILRAALALAIGIASAAAAGTAQAQVLKCTGADGKAVFSDRPCAASQRTETLRPAARPPAAPASAAFGLSFALVTEPAAPVAHLSCHGEPARLDRPHSKSCNPYRGDTSCRASLPIACFKATGASPPEQLKQDFYSGWVGGQLGATRAVVGTTLASEKAASAQCAAELGAGWRMAEFHDGRGGWGLQGERASGIRSGTRYWVRINDQPGNCWDSTP